jgi:two-component system, OmpR family, phosphate regulon sensor histidine kinase PhoR
LKPFAELVTASAMKLKLNSFPWFLYQRLLLPFLVSVVILSIILINKTSYIDIGLAVVLTLFCVRLFFIIAPLSRIIDRVNRIQENLTHDQQLKFFYQKNAWDRIDSALELVEHEMTAKSQQLRSEENRKTSLLEAINDEIVAVDEQLCIIFANKKFMETFDQNKIRLQEKGKIWSLLPYSEINHLFEITIERRESHELKNFSLPTPQGEKFFSIKFMPILNEERIQGAVAVFHDVTEARLTEQMRVDFVANVSHEMRTPLTSIKGFSQILSEQKEKVPSEFGLFLDKIQSNADRMMNLFNDLLQLSVIESQYQPQLVSVSLREMVENIQTTLTPIYREKKIVIDLDLKLDMIQVDEKLFEQVLTNLIDNSCKYAGEAPQIKVKSEKLIDKILITISDSGPGITPEHLKRIFERFYRVDSARDRSHGGTGLGLAIVKHIIQKHQGKIVAESDGKKGTSFIIELPLT